MKLIFLCCEHIFGEFKYLCNELNTQYSFFSSKELENEQSRSQIMNEIMENSEKYLTVILFSNFGMNKTLENFYLALPKSAVIIPIGSDAVLLNGATAKGEDIEKINRYTAFGGNENIKNALKYIINQIGEDKSVNYNEPVEIPFDGIYSFDNNEIYHDLETYFKQKGKNYPVYVGILSHRSAWIKQDLAAEKSISEKLNSMGIGTICVFSYGADNSINSRGFKEIFSECFSLNGNLIIDVLVNFQLFLLKAHKGEDIAKAGEREFSNLNIPIIHPLSHYFLTYKQWENSQNPLGEGTDTSINTAEMTGMIEPISVSVFENGKHIAIEDRINLLCRRIIRYLRLKNKNNSEKKIAIILHNSVCSGVEATIGKAFGLDSFQSVVDIMNNLLRHGYNVNDIPLTGEKLLETIQKHKAISDFRWTGINDIIESGGALYKMPLKEYTKYYNQLPENSRKYMEKTWGAPPGEAMVSGDDIIITGLSFGNISVMVQPKRGCYGAKCTGEVCKILHDPFCPPTHQYLATYRYIENIFDADAVIHVGTEGSLEYLPGKTNCLSQNCWPDIVLGALINLYIYNAGVTGESMIAKRRGKAVLLSHLPLALGIDETSRKIVDKIDSYFYSKELSNNQTEIIKTEIMDLLKDFSQSFEKASENFEEFITELRDKIKSSTFAAPVTDKHIFGKIPDEEKKINFITEIICADNQFSCLENMTDYDFNKFIKENIKLALSSKCENSLLKADVESLYEKLNQTFNEMENLMSALEGGYIKASECGMPDENGRKIIPTGRNLYNVATGKIPTKLAYSRGKEMAEKLLDAYIKDEGKYPEKIAMNMISTDITRTQGEQLSQVLYLLGVKPVWDKQERVVSLAVIPLEDLNRPRIDITVRISGVMRDTWGFAVDMMDTAVMMVAALNEPEQDNFIKKNISEDLENTEDRSKTIRIFGDPPGTYGSGMDLALKASAWNNEKDLAKYFISYSAFAYGNKLNGKKSVKEFIENAKKVDLTCDTSSDKRTDVLACGFGMGIQGGYRMIAKSYGKKTPKQYQSTNIKGQEIKMSSLSEHISKNVDETLLNPLWLDKIMTDGYDGAAEIMHRIQNLFETQCTNECLSDKLIDNVVDTYINNYEVRQWFSENNPYALEETARRMLELYTRKKWIPNEETLENLQNNYLLIEGDMESNVSGNDDLQGGTIEIITDDSVNTWKENLDEIEKFLNKQ